jgi:truncated hemoglobin YjbI
MSLLPENQLFNESYQRLFGDAVTLSHESDVFFERFYSHFLADPLIAELFASTDMTAQVKMLRDSFFQLITFHMINKPLPSLERLAAQHSRLQVSIEMFDIWLNALITTVKEMDDQCDLATEMAWRWALTPGITYMKLVQSGHA